MNVAIVVLDMIRRLLEIVMKAYLGQEIDPGEIDEIWETNKTALAQAEADDLAAEKFKGS